ncbi:hypothetical protein BLNAU_14957 [Blattamonas nauphoetae]|uniref:Uncharacterized protein n=1 Tax=Blattamonas nauphoetae TaxID=2049346 RepID=A0ABQ9XIZ6_9EUKA|nr:hypothetical protein BLNAU_14957 [Blattamonas nauphoetae]
MTQMNPNYLLLPVFGDNPNVFIIKDKDNFSPDEIRLFLNEKGIDSNVYSKTQKKDAYYTLKVDDSQPSMEAMTQLLCNGPCVAIHSSVRLYNYPVTILPLLTPKSLLFTTDTLTLTNFWNKQQTSISAEVQILPLPQQDRSDASIAIFPDNKTTIQAHDSFTNKKIRQYNPCRFARIYAKQDNFGNRIEMEITSISLPSKSLSCVEKATIVNLLNPIITEEITKAIQPHFPVVEAKAFLEWRTIKNGIKSTFRSSEGNWTKDESIAKKTCFTVRLTPYLFVHYHINEITTVLSCEFRIVRSLRTIGGDVSFTFKFCTLSRTELVQETGLTIVHQRFQL